MLIENLFDLHDIRKRIPAFGFSNAREAMFRSLDRAVAITGAPNLDESLDAMMHVPSIVANSLDEPDPVMSH